MFLILAKESPIPSISAFGSSKFQFYIYFRSFRPDFLSSFHDKDIVPRKSFTFDCCFRVKPPPNAPVVRFCPPAAPRFAVWIPKKLWFSLLRKNCFIASQREVKTLPSKGFVFNYKDLRWQFTLVLQKSSGCLVGEIAISFKTRCPINCNLFNRNPAL